MMPEEMDAKQKLLKIVQEAVQQDKNLREQFQIGDKFRFIRDRLQALLSHTQQSLQAIEPTQEEKTQSLAADELLVYVYLFNAQGLILSSWQKMLNSSVFYEHSVNRPIYGEQNHVEAFIRSKSSKGQHAYLTVAVRKQDIIAVKEGSVLQDAIGNPLIKVREGSLHYQRLISFTHQGNDYTVSKAGELIGKQK